MQPENRRGDLVRLPFSLSHTTQPIGLISGTGGTSIASGAGVDGQDSGGGRVDNDERYGVDLTQVCLRRGSTIRQQGAITLLDSQVVWGNTRPNIHIDD